MIRALCLALLALIALPAPLSAQLLDKTPRTVVMTAFLPEWNALRHSIHQPKEHKINGLVFLTGKLAGKPVVLMQSGVSMVNAAMNTQLALDRFAVKRIVFSGIAGGIDPSLTIGDVVVPEDWAQYLEVSFARKTADGWSAPEVVDPRAPPNFTMMFPRGVQLGNAGEPPRRHFRLATDPALVALARRIASSVVLRKCVAGADAWEESEPQCLSHEPKVVVGGTGVSAGVFVDNAEFRNYLFSAWKARVVDMESAAVGQVAYANTVPFIAFRSLSDLAGGDAGKNQMTTFMTLASVNSADVVRAFLAALPD